MPKAKNKSGDYSIAAKVVSELSVNKNKSLKVSNIPLFRNYLSYINKGSEKKFTTTVLKGQEYNILVTRIN